VLFGVVTLVFGVVVFLFGVLISAILPTIEYEKYEGLTGD